MRSTFYYSTTDFRIPRAIQGNNEASKGVSHLSPPLSESGRNSLGAGSKISALTPPKRVARREKRVECV